MIAMSNGGRLIGAQCHADALASEIVNISNRPPIPLRTQPLAVPQPRSKASSEIAARFHLGTVDLRDIQWRRLNCMVQP
jgi:hypothetical protein